MLHRRTLSVFILLALLCGPLLAPAHAAESDDGHRIVGLLEYIGADYQVAVDDGKVVNDFEYEEMQNLADEAQDLAGAGTDESLRSQLQTLDGLIEKKASVERVASAASDAERLAVQAYGIERHPEVPPNRENGRELYLSNCTSCHGKEGRAEVAEADSMKPPPTNFHDPGRRENLSPYRVFNTTKFGIEGTPMNAYNSLSAAERWDLGFYVLSLAHGGPPAEEAIVGERPVPEGFEPGLEKLAKWNDGRLRDELEKAGLEGEHLEAAVSYLRTVRPFEVEAKSSRDSSGGGGKSGIPVVRDRLAKAREQFEAGDSEKARRSVVDAYLEGFEGLESRLAPIDRQLLKSTESKFMSLRQALRRGDDRAAAKNFEALSTAIDDVEAALSRGSTSWWTTAVASAVILLREGVEVVLLVVLLLGLLERLGREEAKKHVHGGWVAALVAGGLTWVAAQWLITISGAGRELLEGIIGLLAAAVLFSVSYWFLSQFHGKKWLDYLRSKLEKQATAGRFLTVAGLSFLAVYREAFETVLFYQALLVESNSAVEPVLAGIAVAAVGLAIFAYLIIAAGKSLPMKQFFAVSGVLLLALSVMLTGEGLHALVEAGVVPSHPVPFVSIEWLGVYPNLVPLAGQGIVLAAIATWAVWAMVRRDEE